MRKKILFALSLVLAFAVGFGACLGVDAVLRARLGTPEEVAETICFLAGPESRFVTGQVLGVNGGMVI